MNFLIFLALSVTVFSQDYSGDFKDPDHPGKCVRDGLILSPGEERKVPGECALMTCYDDGFATFKTCGTMVAPPGCQFGDYFDIDAPFGDCCEMTYSCY
ncbi:uncharacterized protein LOC119600313 [Lucilia sericata]|uniref:uncharacterized protein LOC119600313 n=1 Tax=Lucilia sericata TaxID=13632 RepID=UPI0018A82EE2|nr:uncharacterized protein LOC119600313 [Lucilia sericata]XP_037806402.1 uncharacterized protein LOC119600313 [Lucilia sericata]